jgi:hypothetical protein
LRRIDRRELKHKWLYYGLALLLAMLVAFFFGYLGIEAHMYWYLNKHGIQRHELSNDFGFAFENVATGLIVLLISFVVALIVSFRCVSKYLKK